MKNGKDSQPIVMLIAEDNVIIADLVAAIVVKTGAEAVIAHDGEHALILAHSCAPSLLITYLVMPRMGGDALIKALRREWGATLPMTPMSGSPISVMLEAGAGAILSKPFEGGELLALIERSLVDCPA